MRWEGGQTAQQRTQQRSTCSTARPDDWGFSQHLLQEALAVLAGDGTGAGAALKRRNSVGTGGITPGCGMSRPAVDLAEPGARQLARRSNFLSGEGRAARAPAAAYRRRSMPPINWAVGQLNQGPDPATAGRALGHVDDLWRSAEVQPDACAEGASAVLFPWNRRGWLQAFLMNSDLGCIGPEAVDLTQSMIVVALIDGCS